MKRKWFNLDSLLVLGVVLVLVMFICLAFRRDSVEKQNRLPKPKEIQKLQTEEESPRSNEDICNTLFDEWLSSIEAIAYGDHSIVAASKLFEASQKVHGFRTAPGRPVFLVENTTALKRHTTIIHLHQLAATLLYKPDDQKIRSELIQGLRDEKLRSSKTQ